MALQGPEPGRRQLRQHAAVIVARPRPAAECATRNSGCYEFIRIPDRVRNRYNSIISSVAALRGALGPGRSGDRDFAFLRPRSERKWVGKGRFFRRGEWLIRVVKQRPEGVRRRAFTDPAGGLIFLL